MGIFFECIELPHETTFEELSSVIQNLNHDEKIHGIILQLPLPSHLKPDHLLPQIAPHKDVDGLHPHNLGALFQDAISFAPCTPQGCVQLLKHITPDLSGKKAIILGRSNLVGKPLMHLLLRQNMTVQVAHSKSLSLRKLCHENEVIICAMGAPRLIDETYVKDYHTIIDVGITKMKGRFMVTLILKKLSLLSNTLHLFQGGLAL